MMDKPAPGRPKVLLSAYACEPGRGSEPGVGWRWANGLASRVELTVLTRASNRAAIESHRESLPDGHPLRSVRFEYFDLGPLALRLKQRGLLPTFGYYVLWQRAVARHFAGLAESAQVVHHLTFCSLLCPGLWRLERAVSVIGPVGAPLVPRSYFPLFGKQAVLQSIRDRLMRGFHHLPWLRRVLGQASVVVPANSETAGLLKTRGFRSGPVMLDTGSPEPGGTPVEKSPRSVVRFLYAGRLERRKGIELSLRALAHAEAAGTKSWEFHLLGSGPDARRLRELAAELGIGGKVVFAGAVDHEEVLVRMGEADVFFFTSVRDTSGGVNLEAMAMGLPVLCLAHQGVGDITNESCAIRIPPGEIDETIRGLADGVRRFCSDPELRESMGRIAGERALRDFRWEDKFDLMAGHYLEALRTRGRTKGSVAGADTRKT